MEEETLSFLRGFTVGAILSGIVTAAVIVSVLQERDMVKPYTLNRLDRWTGDITTLLFTTEHRAVAAATEEVLWESTAWVTVTDERTGEELFDEQGSFCY